MVPIKGQISVSDKFGQACKRPIAIGIRIPRVPNINIILAKNDKYCDKNNEKYFILTL